MHKERKETTHIRLGKRNIYQYIKKVSTMCVNNGRKRGEESGFCVCFGMKEREGLYSSGGENMNGRPFNEG